MDIGLDDVTRRGSNDLAASYEGNEGLHKC